MTAGVSGQISFGHEAGGNLMNEVELFNEDSLAKNAPSSSLSSSPLVSTGEKEKARESSEETTTGGRGLGAMDEEGERKKNDSIRTTSDSTSSSSFFWQRLYSMPLHLVSSIVEDVTRSLSLEDEEFGTRGDVREDGGEGEKKNHNAEVQHREEEERQQDEQKGDEEDRKTWGAGVSEREEGEQKDVDERSGEGKEENAFSRGVERQRRGDGGRERCLEIPSDLEPEDEEGTTTEEEEEELRQRGKSLHAVNPHES